jgi:4-amino-4-deoxy-L-arabinose transferase-like glycosyltransferase
LAFLLAGYLASRLYALTSFPLFIDEAIHIQWSRETLRGALLAGSWGGRWLTIKVMAAFVALPIDPLLAARLSATLAGAGALLACVLVGRRLYSSTEGLVAGLLYLVLPYALLYNRLALAETLATALAGAVLCLSVTAASSERRRDIAALAVALVCMFLAKFYTIVLVLIPVAAVILLQPQPTWLRRLARLSPAYIAVALVFGLMVWRGHGTQYMGEQSAVGSWWSQTALIRLNLERASGWLWALLTPPLAIAFLLALLWLLRRDREPADLLLAGAFVLSAGPFVLAAQIWFPRYLAPALVPICVLLARFACSAAARVSSRSFGLDRRMVRAGLAAMAMGMIAWPLWLDAQIIIRPQDAALPRIERAEFLDGWSAGTGVPQLADYLRTRSLASTAGINVVRFYFWNHANLGLNVYLSPTSTLAMHTINPTDPDAPATIARLAANRPSLFVLNPPNDAEHLAEIGKSLDDYLPGASRVWSYPRPKGKSGLEVWELRRD